MEDRIVSILSQRPYNVPALRGRLIAQTILTSNNPDDTVVANAIGNAIPDPALRASATSAILNMGATPAQQPQGQQPNQAQLGGQPAQPVATAPEPHADWARVAMWAIAAAAVLLLAYLVSKQLGKDDRLGFFTPVVIEPEAPPIKVKARSSGEIVGSQTAQPTTPAQPTTTPSPSTSASQPSNVTGGTIIVQPGGSLFMGVPTAAQPTASQPTGTVDLTVRNNTRHAIDVN